MINLALIKDNAKSQHKQFIDRFGLRHDKMLADSVLLIDKVKSNVKSILAVLQEVRVIDFYKSDDGGGYCKYSLGCTWSDSTLDLYSDGIYIAVHIRSHNCLLGGDTESKCLRIWDSIPVYSKDFDWNEFANYLVKIIHEHIYEQDKILLLQNFGEF